MAAQPFSQHSLRPASPTPRGWFINCPQRLPSPPTINYSHLSRRRVAYAMENSHYSLTPEQLQSFEGKGYLVIPGFLSSGEP